MNRKELFESAKKAVVSEIAHCSKTGENRLPTARVLAEKAGCSYATMRLVLAELEREGFLCRCQGSGTYLTECAGELAGKFLIRKLLYFCPHRLGRSDTSFNDFLTELLERECAERGWNCTTVHVRSHDEFLRNMKAAASFYDAVVYAPVGEAFTVSHIAALDAMRGIPLVLLDNNQALPLPCISIDDWRGGAMAASHFLANNHREIGLLFAEPPLQCIQERADAFLDVVELAGLRPHVIRAEVGRDDDRRKCARAAMEQVIRRGRLPFSALFGVSDASAWGALDAFQDAGIRVPDEVSLIGFDGLPFNDRTSPPLCSVAQPFPQIFERLFRLLDSGGPPENRKFRIPPGFKKGKSVLRLPPVPLTSSPFYSLAEKQYAST